jgi:prophage regulatory protein
MRELKQLLGLSHSTLWKMAKEGRLPKPVHVSERTTAWRMGDILAWQAGLGEAGASGRARA